MPKRDPVPVADVVSELFARRGFGRSATTDAYGEAWQEAAGPEMAELTRPLGIRRGVLQVAVADSTAMSELMFQKEQILEKLNRLEPAWKITGLKFRVGPVS